MLYVIGDTLGIIVLLAAFAVPVAYVQNRARTLMKNRECEKIQGAGCEEDVFPCCIACSHCSQTLRLPAVPRQSSNARESRGGKPDATTKG